MRFGGAALLFVSFWLAGCAPGSPPATPDLSTPEPTASPSIEADRLFGRIVEIDRGAPTVTVAVGQFFGLPESVEAARADGVIGPNEDLPNPFYIRDLHERSTLDLEESAIVTVQGWDAEGNIMPVVIDLAAFAAALPNGPADLSWTVSGYYWFDVEAETVTGIEAQYIP